MNYKIEQATKDDLKSILSLNQDSIPAVSSSNLEMMKHFLIICDYFKVCKINGEIIGFLNALYHQKSIRVNIINGSMINMSLSFMWIG